MIKEGNENLITPLTDLLNGILNENENIPESSKLADIISIYKGKGGKQDLNNQRGISLTSSILKCLERVIANRIENRIRENTTSLQGVGKKGEATEEYILMIKTIIDINKKNRKNTKMIITDVKKAFDQAWRKGVFKNLIERKIEGKLFNLMWELNNNLKARIKFDEKNHSIYCGRFNKTG